MFKKKNTQVIEFAVNDGINQMPVPAKKHVPEWWKQSNLYIDGHSDLTTSNILAHTFKRCGPFMDSFLTGYIAELWCDVLVKRNPDGSPHLIWRITPEPVEMRPITGSELLPVPHGHNAHRFAWRIPYHLKTARGYSCLITHPFNRYDLPFTIMSAVVDTHEVMYAGNVPFFIKNDFEGLIPKGTPLYQIIPFKREDWISKENNSLIPLGQKNSYLSSAVFHGWYKKMVRQHKNFN